MTAQQGLWMGAAGEEDRDGSQARVASSHMHCRRKSFAICPRPGVCPQPPGHLKEEQVPNMDGKVISGSLWTQVFPEQTTSLGTQMYPGTGPGNPVIAAAL